MTRLRLILTNAWRLRRRYSVLVVVLLVGAALVAVGATLGSYAQTEAQAGVDDNAALRRISVYGGNGGQPLDSDRLTQVRAVRGVQSATPVLQVPVGLEKNRSLITLTNLRENAPPPLARGSLASLTTGDSIAVPSTIEGQDAFALLGTRQKVSYTQGVTTTSGKQGTRSYDVVAIYDASWQVDGPAAAYCSLKCVTELAALRAGVPAALFGEMIGYDRVDVTAATASEVASVTSAIQARGFHAVSVQQELAAVPGVVALVRLITGVLFVLVLLLGALSAVGMAQALARQRNKEAAIMQTLGWRPSQILRVLLGELAVVAFVACVTGTALGVVAGLWSGSYLGGQLDVAQGLSDPRVPSLTALLLGLATAMIVVVLGAYLPLHRASRADVTTTLREL